MYYSFYIVKCLHRLVMSLSFKEISLKNRKKKHQFKFQDTWRGFIFLPPMLCAAFLRLPEKYCWRTLKLTCFSAALLFFSVRFLNTLGVYNMKHNIFSIDKQKGWNRTLKTHRRNIICLGAHKLRVVETQLSRAQDNCSRTCKKGERKQDTRAQCKHRTVKYAIVDHFKHCKTKITCSAKINKGNID